MRLLLFLSINSLSLTREPVVYSPHTTRLYDYAPPEDVQDICYYKSKAIAPPIVSIPTLPIALLRL